MARTRIKCLFILFSLVYFVSARSLPLIRESMSSISIRDEVYSTPSKQDETIWKASNEIVQEIKYDQNTTNRNFNRNEETLNNIRPGQSVSSYKIELTREGDNIKGKAIIDVILSDQSLRNPIKFNIMGLDIENVQVGQMTDTNLQDADSDIINDVILQIRPRQAQATTNIVVIDYSVPLRNDGTGIFLGTWDDNEYIAMNLHPTNARRVFPCMDEPNLSARYLTFTFKDMDNFARLLTNSRLVEGSTTIFETLEGPVHRWAMVAHSLNHVNTPVTDLVNLYAREGTNRQETVASGAISHFYNALNEWTGREHQNIIRDQNGGLHVMAMPDVARDWYGLSTLCIWEPYILMENNNAVKQRKTALVTIAEGMARQWFGWALFPENWRDQWVTAGLASYVAYEIAKDFQTPPEDQEDNSLIDMNAIFTTDVIQESLLYDAYASATALRLNDPIFEEHQIRQHTLGLLKTKAPALLRMTRLVLSEERDLVQTAAQGLLNRRIITSVTTTNLYESLSNGYGSDAGSGLIGSVEEFLRPWVENEGYPVITVTMRRGGVYLMQERFGFSERRNVDYTTPLTFTTSSDPNFDEIFPTHMMTSSLQIDLELGEDWIIFNLQGQGYYRVNYDDTWDRLIRALSDPETREEIHPLNRASLLDDALNLARAGKIDYAIALQIALTMELETEYAVWKAFVRNMDFIRKRLVPFVEENDRDDNIYLRMIRRTIVTVQKEIGFEPEAAEPAMISLTRGLVMEHACKVGYEPCVAAAVDIFYDPSNEGEINPDIPPEIRPAVYCTMIREDEENEVREALESHLDQLESRYERLVILESLACSNDGGFILTLLRETISDTSSYNFVLEERLKVFAAVASSSFQNSVLALNFLIVNTQEIREMYGGPDKLEEAIFIMAENVVNAGQKDQFNNWVNSQNELSRLDDSIEVARRARHRLNENLDWIGDNLEDVYDWIDENDASTVFASTLLLCISMCIALFNQY
ncbi:aminopeptidase N-like [Maniola jurtina]|uniref:aminopeptidase N-like n=1 Tax=Maniola jurtina TaxID=191418 RepID=UPI001E6865D6|nr:aminopeptidase N-like [Maniola jurtina]